MLLQSVKIKMRIYFLIGIFLGISGVSFAQVDETINVEQQQLEDSSLPDTDAEESSKKSEEENSENKKSWREVRKERQRWKFGEFRLRLGAARPFFDGKIDDIYRKLYGTPKVHFQMSGDYFFWQKFAAIGAGAKFGYYVAQGHAATLKSGISREDATADDFVIDETEPTELIYIPMQLYATIQFTPFPHKYLVLDAWAGYERGYLQEVRSGSALPSASDSAISTNAAKTNKSWINSGTVGVSLNILISHFDKAASNTLRNTMKMQGIYLSPYVELVTPLGDVKGFDFKRTNVGVAFTFEGI